MADSTRWTQVEGTIYWPQHYRQEDGWHLHFDKNRSEPRWVISHGIDGKAPEGMDDPGLKPDQVAEAQAWADRVLTPVLRDNRSLGVTWK
jgi:hypothetical protein